jgi:pilus assembly protein FimV
LALDKEKILDLAQKWVIKGQPKKAIAEYIKLIEADPKDARLYLKLGDLYFKIGENEKAIAEYMKLAGLYAEEDLNSRAISIYKRILTINPKHIDALHKIAGLYLKEG